MITASVIKELMYCNNYNFINIVIKTIKSRLMLGLLLNVSSLYDALESSDKWLTFELGYRKPQGVRSIQCSKFGGKKHLKTKNNLLLLMVLMFLLGLPMNFVIHDWNLKIHMCKKFELYEMSLLGILHFTLVFITLMFN